MYSWKDKASYLVIFFVRIETETHGSSKANDQSCFNEKTRE